MRMIIDYHCGMDRRQHPHTTAPMTASAPQVVDSRTLLQPGQSVVIRHNGVLYTLRETRQGKLILTK
jgi:hemin uptake protein HemP